MNSNENKTAKFTTVLIARETTEAPTDLEIKLRQCTQKLRVVPSLTGGAKILFPTSHTTVAVRVYDAVTITEMEKRVQQNRNLLQDDFHEVCSFRDSFKHSIIFFVLKSDIISDQLGRVESVVNTLQRRLCAYEDIESAGSGKKKGNARVFVVSDIESVLHTVSITLNSLTREKCTLKEKFFLSQAKRNFLPDIDTGEVEYQKAVAEHVTNMFRSWSENVGISTSDANVIMNVLGSLDQILAADEGVLKDVPVDSSVKKKILQFFGKMSAATCSDAFDNSFETMYGGTSQRSVQPCNSDTNNFADFSMQRRKREIWDSVSSHQQMTDIPPCSQYQPNVHPQKQISTKLPLHREQPLVAQLGGSRLQHRNSNQHRFVEQSFHLEENKIVPPSQLYDNAGTSAQYYGKGTFIENTDFGNANDNFYTY